MNVSANITMIEAATAETISNVFVNNNCAAVTLQITGSYTSATVLVEGLVNLSSNAWVSLGAIELGDFELNSDGLSEKSLYQVGIEGIPRVRIHVAAVSGGDITVVCQFGNAVIDPSADVTPANLTPVTAYDMAVAGGYTGTKAQFETDMGNSATNATNAAASASAAAASATTASNAAANFAPAYSSSATYAVGDHVLYNGGYYVCNTAITTAEAWTAAHWTAVKVGPEITDLKTQISNIADDIDTEYTDIDANYAVGNFSTSTGTITAIKTAVVTQNFLVAKIGSKISPDVGYQIKVAIYNSDSSDDFDHYVEWTENEVTIEKDCYIRIGIANVASYGEQLTDTTYSQYINYNLRRYKYNLSDYENDVGYITGDNVPQFQRTANLFNPISVVVGSLVYTNGNIQPNNTNFRTSDFIPVTAGLNYIGDYTNHICWYDSTKTFISGTNNVFSSTAPNNAAFCRIDINTDTKSVNNVMLVQDTTLPNNYIPYYEPMFLVPYDKTTGITYSILQPWKSKNVLFYGDSITAQINGDTPTSWSTYIKNALSLNSVHGRGVGGQTYFWNTNTFKVDSDGNYVSRGGADDNCLGCFPSWQRISSMIPDSIKNTIDIIIIMGGTNDIGNVEEQTGSGSIEWVSPIWSSENDTDTAWTNATEYNGGDYDVSTFTGAIASTIMKMQVRCPNAKIVIASPLSRWNTTNHIPYTKENVSMQDMADVEHKTANYMSVPFIDITALCGINGWNYSTYIGDGVHPNTAGGKMLASAMLSGFESIYPKIR